jgi:DNA (cytosine-5)-methyltransferase 1
MNKQNESKNKKFSIVSLFSGAGGMDMGFELEGFQTIWANDIDKDSCLTHKSWSGAEVVQGDIEKLNYAFIPNSDVILGGFPCQGFSLAGPRKVDDKRNKLYRSFVRLVEEKQPLAFVAENVKGLLTLGNGEIVKAIEQDFSDKGYTVKYKLHNAADFNVPQDRFRVIMVGIRKDLDYKFIFPDKSIEKISLKDVLFGRDEPDLSDICTQPYSSRFMSRNRKKNWEDVSYTIPAMAKQVPIHPSSPDMKKIHKDLWVFGDEQKTRRFSWQEAALIQTFPSELYFQGNLVSKYKQIGNAVPVNLARAVAKNLYQSLIEII